MKLKNVRILALSMFCSSILILFSCNSKNDNVSTEKDTTKKEITPPKKEEVKVVNMSDLIIGKWIVVKKIRLNNNVVEHFQTEYKKKGDFVEKVEFKSNGSELKKSIYDYTKEYNPNGEEISKYTYKIVNDKKLIEKYLWGSNNDRTTSYYFEIEKLTNDSLIIKSLGSKIDIQEYVEGNDNYRIIYTRIKQ